MRLIPALLIILTTSTVVTGAEKHEVIQIITPMTIVEAVKWDVYTEVVPLKESGVLFDTKAVRGSILLVYSYQIIEVNGRSVVAITYLRPRQ